MRWEVAPGHPWRVARHGVVIGTVDGTVVLTGLGAAAFAALPASPDELRADLLLGPDEAGDLDVALEWLAAHGLTVGA